MTDAELLEFARRRVGSASTSESLLAECVLRLLGRLAAASTPPPTATACQHEWRGYPPKDGEPYRAPYALDDVWCHKCGANNGHAEVGASTPAPLDSVVVELAADLDTTPEHLTRYALDAVGASTPPPEKEIEMDDLRYLDVVGNPPVGVRVHWRDGHFFQRTKLGAVLVTLPDSQQKVIPPNEWASIVASVSATGESSETLEKALALHDGR